MDDTAALLSLADRMLWVTALGAAPVLLASLAVGVELSVASACFVFLRQETASTARASGPKSRMAELSSMQPVSGCAA